LDHIIFHNDVDGIVSAGLFQIYNSSSTLFNYSTSCLHPASSTMRGEALKKMLEKIPKEEPIAILDFEFNDRANVWIDHHFNNDIGPLPVYTDKMKYDPMEKSAARIISNMKKNEEHYELISMVDMIDSGSYPDAKFVFESDHPLMILRAYLETLFPSDMAYSRIAECIALNNANMNIVIKKLGIDYQCVKNIKNIANKISKDVLKFGRCSTVYQTRRDQFPRYSEYFLIPEIEYAVRISLSGPRLKYVQVGHNPWCKKNNKINVGEFLRNLPYCRGGGHFSVGAGVIKNEDEEKFLDDVDIHFSKDKEMEKYGVDKEDRVEKRAQELVKTGMDLGEARELSKKETEDGKNAGDEVKL